MGKVYPTITESLATWINQQHMFFVATAPLASEGLINCSPKGLDSFAILNPQTVAYLDLTGSGAETIAHVKENKRIVIMFCAFEGPANIVRLHGNGSVIEPHQPEFEILRPHFPNYAGIRSIIKVDVQRIADSCGYGVPQYEYKKERDTLLKYVENLGPDGVMAYQAQKNRRSLDGLPALEQTK